MMSIAGTISNSVKLAQMEGRWYQKKNAASKKKDEKNMTAEERQMLRFQEDAERMREAGKRADLDAKIKAGGTLTKEEAEYLKEKDPEAYRDYEEIKREKEYYENQLKKCKTKEEVEKLKNTRMGMFMSEVKSISQNPHIPKFKKKKWIEKLYSKMANDEKAHESFVKSLTYTDLPTEEEVRKKEKKPQYASDTMSDELLTAEETSVEGKLLEEILSAEAAQKRAALPGEKS